MKKQKPTYRLQRKVFLYWQNVADFTKEKEAGKHMKNMINEGIPASLFRILTLN